MRTCGAASTDVLADLLWGGEDFYTILGVVSAYCVAVMHCISISIAACL